MNSVKAIKKDTPSSVRVRDNQRRSRTRRKELLEDLQKRVRQFELNGVEATQEMQLAARKVALENMRLRHLLELRGVHEEDVNTYLRSFRMPEPETGSSELSAIDSSNFYTSPTLARTITENSAVSFEGPSLEQTPQALRRSQPLLGRPCMQTRSEELVVRQSQHADSHPCEFNNCGHGCDSSEELHASYSDPIYVCPSMTQDSDELEPGLETSCEAAAKIILEIWGNADKASARASLGCTGTEDCNVKNTTILQVMSEI